MATRPVTVRVDEDVYARAKIYIDREGATFRSAVAAMLSDIAETGQVPGTGAANPSRVNDRARRLADEARAASRPLPEGMTLSDDDVRRMLRDRDDL